jgi:hypothetical protein
MDGRRSQSAPSNNKITDRSPPLACKLHPIENEEQFMAFKHFIQDLADKTERNLAAQLSVIEQRLRSSASRQIICSSPFSSYFKMSRHPQNPVSSSLLISLFFLSSAEPAKAGRQALPAIEAVRARLHARRHWMNGRH